MSTYDPSPSPRVWRFHLQLSQVPAEVESLRVIHFVCLCIFLAEFIEVYYEKIGLHQPLVAELMLSEKT